MPRRASSSSGQSPKKPFAFRTTASKKASAAAKIVSFEDVEAQATAPRTRKVATKSKPSTQPSTPELPPSPDAVEHSKSRKRPASARKTSPKKKTATPKLDDSKIQEGSKKQKTTSRYPAIDFDAEQYRGRAETSHKQTLVQIVKDVCAIELQGLQQQFSRHDGKTDILNSMESVLSDLPALVNQEVEDSATYKPERQLQDVKALRECDEAIQQLIRQKERLQHLVDNLEECGEQFDIMLRAPEDEEEAKNIEPSSQTQTAVDNFKAQLGDMIQSVQSLKGEASSISNVMSRAYEAQSTLYDTFHATSRFEGVHRSSTHDTIRQLVQFS